MALVKYSKGSLLFTPSSLPALSELKGYQLQALGVRGADAKWRSQGRSTLPCVRKGSKLLGGEHLHGGGAGRLHWRLSWGWGCVKARRQGSCREKALEPLLLRERPWDMEGAWGPHFPRRTFSTLHIFEWLANSTSDQLAYIGKLKMFQICGYFRHQAKLERKKSGPSQFTHAFLDSHKASENLRKVPALGSRIL